MEQYEQYYNDEISICRLIPDMHSPVAGELVRHGKFSEAAALYLLQAEEYDMVGRMNVLCLPEKEFKSTIRTVSYDDVDMFMMGRCAADSVMFELNQLRTARRGEIARIGRERAKIARENADIAQKKAGECQKTGCRAGD